MSVHDWAGTWRGQWIWDAIPDEAFWWRPTAAEGRFVYLRRVFHVDAIPPSLFARASCDSRYVLHLNGEFLGRGPVRGEPEHLGWDEYDLAPHLRAGPNVLVALCRYYGRPGPWWIPAAPLGTLGRGSFCLETDADAPIDVVTDDGWNAMEASWSVRGTGNMHAFPSEVVDGRGLPDGLHDPNSADPRWHRAVVVSGRGHGTVLDRPPAAPYMTPLRRPIPQLTSLLHSPRPLEADARVRVERSDDPLATWQTLTRDGGDRIIRTWDLGGITIGHVHLRIVDVPAAAVGGEVDVVGGEELRSDGLPEVAPRDWAARYLIGELPGQAACFFDPVGVRFLAAHAPAGVEVEIAFEEARYPREEGAAFASDDPRYDDRWQLGLRTVDMCATDAFVDCPGREQRAWVSDAYPQILVSLVTNPDQRLVRHHLALTARSRLSSGLLAGAAACDFARIGFTMPEYSLHWIRSLAAYWLYSGDDAFVRAHRPIADAIIERYELQRGPSGLIEDMPGWVFLDWAQVDRDVVTGAHDGLYVAALRAYATLPDAAAVAGLIEATASGFEALWDADRDVYVDAIGASGRSRRISQHTNGTALLGDLVPRERVRGVIDRISSPATSPLGGRLVVTETSADVRTDGRIPTYQYEKPADFDEERDVVAAQPWFCRFLHEAYFAHGRTDLIMTSLLRWNVLPGMGTLQEFWNAEPGRSSRCHGWSSSPTFDLTSYVLGVRPLEPGWGRLVVDPQLVPLDHAEGRVATPHGWIHAEVDRKAIEVELPNGVVADIGGTEYGPGRHRHEFPVEPD